MDRLESRLREVLRRQDPPAGFAERVMTRTLETKRHTWTGIFAWHSLRWVLAGALCVAIMMAGIEYRQAREERARSKAAKEQLLQALQIAGDQLQFVWSKVYQP